MVVHERDSDRLHAITMRGLIHELTVMTTLSDNDPLLVQIDRGPETMTCLLDQDDIDALAKFFARHASTRIT